MQWETNLLSEKVCPFFVLFSTEAVTPFPPPPPPSEFFLKNIKALLVNEKNASEKLFFKKKFHFLILF